VNKAKLLRNSLNNNQGVAIYARTSGVLIQEVILLGKITKLDINLNRYEEDKLISEFNPVWNVTRSELQKLAEASLNKTG
jgi:hypothetical protein